jgi:hypothetical protein
MNMLQLFQPGDVIYGFCNGFFGRDDYETKTCVLVRPRYAVFEYASGQAATLNEDGRLDEQTVAKWKEPYVDL